MPIGDHETAPGTGQADNASQVVNFEEQYNQLRPEYTRVTQEIAPLREQVSEYEQLFSALHDPDPEVQRAAFDALGLELDSGSPESVPEPDADEFVDPLEREIHELRGQMTELRSAREQEAAEREFEQVTAMRDEYIGEAITYLEDQLKQERGRDFSFNQKEETALGNLAIALSDEDSVPDVQTAYELLYGTEGVLETNRQRWIDSKTGAAVPPAGTSIPADRKPTNRRERIAYIDERVAAMERQQ